MYLDSKAFISKGFQALYKSLRSIFDLKLLNAGQKLTPERHTLRSTISPFWIHSLHWMRSLQFGYPTKVGYESDRL